MHLAGDRREAKRRIAETPERDLERPDDINVGRSMPAQPGIDGDSKRYRSAEAPGHGANDECKDDSILVGEAAPDVPDHRPDAW